MSTAEHEACLVRVARLAGELRERELDALLVETLVDVRYLTGFTGSNALVLVAPDTDTVDIGPHRFISDFRYATQSAKQVGEAFAREIVTGDLLDAVPAALAHPGGRARESGRLGFDDASLTVKRHAQLAELLGPGWELVPCAGAVAGLRAVKDVGEIARIRAASELADEALRGVLEDGLVGRCERDVAIELELRMRRLGAQGPSFPSIVAAGAHGALPHAAPRAQAIAKDVLVTIDWGAVHGGYCSDCTRTYATGEGISTRAREVLRARAERPGTGGGGGEGGTEWARGGRGGARGDRRGRARRALRPRPRPRRGHGGPRGSAPVADGGR